jgi:hypothetical protein
LRPSSPGTVSWWAGRDISGGTETSGWSTVVLGTPVGKARTVDWCVDTQASSNSCWITNSTGTQVRGRAGLGDEFRDSVTASVEDLVGTDVVINTEGWRLASTTNTETTARRETSILDNVIGSWARKEQQLIQRGRDGIKRWGSEPISGNTFSQDGQMFRGKGKIRISSWGTNTHCNGGESSGWRKQRVVSGSQVGNSSNKVRTASRESTGIDTAIFISEVIDGTISQSQEHLWNVSDGSSIVWIIEG